MKTESENMKSENIKPDSTGPESLKPANADSTKNKILTIPNLLSLFRLCLIPVFMWLYCVEKNYLWTGIILIISGLTDTVDGFVARHFNMISDLGKILDPVADKLTQAAMLFCHNNPVASSSLPAQLKDKEDASFEAMAAFVRKAPSIEWKKENIYGLMKEIMDEQGVKVLHLAIPLRVLVTGAEKTPSIDATLELYGQERVLTRLNEGMEKWAAQRAGN